MEISNSTQELLNEWSLMDCDEISFDNLESKLESELEEQLSDLEGLEEDRKEIGNPDSLSKTIMDVVWEQFIIRVGQVAGEDFIKANRGLPLDLRNDAHIQTTENFKNGKTADHNTQIDYKERYKEYDKNFKHDQDGNVITHKTRSGADEATLADGARKPFDQGRPSGSKENKTEMDHTISAGEIIRDPQAAAHTTKEERVAFANSAKNLNEMPSDQNHSKGDKPMQVWLNTPNSKGQKPEEIFEIDEETKRKYLEKDAEAREEYEKLKEEGEKRSKETGRQSQREEASRMGGKAIRAVLMGLLLDFIKEMLQKLIKWFRSSTKTIKTLLESLKEALRSFFSNLKKHLKKAGDTFMTTIVTAIFGPIIGTIKKAWSVLKQGYKSLKDAIQYLRNPENKHLPFSTKLLQVGKFVITGLAAGSSIVLGDVIKNALMTIPGFGFPIPMLGSLADLLGIFLGALVSGLIGALALNMIDRVIAKKMENENVIQQIKIKDTIIVTQETLNEVTRVNVGKKMIDVAQGMSNRHAEAAEKVAKDSEGIEENTKESNELHEFTSKSNDDIDDLLSKFDK